MSAQPPLPPPGLNYIAVIEPALHDILLGHTFTVLFLPLFISLFFFSTTNSRRKPVFFLNVVAVLLALAVGIMIDYRAVRTIVFPNILMPLSFNIAIGLLGAIQSILVDTILLVRLLIVYPLAHTRRSRFVAIFTLPLVLKLARIINLILFIRVLALADGNALLIARVWGSSPYLKIEWIMQLVDNTYASVLFLWRLGFQSGRGGVVSVESAGGSRTSFTRQLRTLLYIAATNFVFPACFSLVQLLVVFLDVNVAVVNDIVLANTSIAVFGVVFATVWAGSANSDWLAKRRGGSGGVRVDMELGKHSKESVVSAMRFAESRDGMSPAARMLASGQESRTFGSIQGADPLFMIPEKEEGSGKETSSNVDADSMHLTSIVSHGYAC